MSLPRNIQPTCACDQPPQRATPARRHVCVRAVRVAGLVGETMVLAMGRDPLDHRPLDRHRAEHREHGAHRAARLEAAMGEQPVVADGDAQPRQEVHDRQHDQVVPVQASSPREPACPPKRNQRCAGHDRAHHALERLVLDGDHVGLAPVCLCLSEDVHVAPFGQACVTPGKSARGSVLRAIFEASPTSVSTTAKRLFSVTTDSASGFS